MKRRGLTLLELLIALAGTVVITSAVFFAYAAAVRVGPNIDKGQTAIDQDNQFRDKVTDILHHVYLLNNGATATPGATGQRTYFTTNPQSSTSGLAQGGSSGGSTSASGSGGTGTELVFTSLGEPTSQAAIQDNSQDFTAQNNTRGPQGGMIEYAIETSPVGNAGDKKGIFLREQRPADTDPTSGGEETLLLPDIDNVTFEFWDGQEWQTSWDTTTQTSVRLPAAVRITYSKGNDTPKVFVVQIPMSNATAQDPVTDFGTGASAAAGTQ